MKFIETFKSPNFNERTNKKNVKYIILHYTAINESMEAIDHLCSTSSKVGSHFLVNKIGEIYYLINTTKRAWHAGKSYWNGITDLNSASIGIEIDNSGLYNNNEGYPDKQIKSLINLIKKISRDFNISTQNILAHSDIAPYRKIDPGEKFPWEKLNEQKLSYLPQINKSDKILKTINDKTNNLSVVMNKKALVILKNIGYDTRFVNILSNKYKKLIKAYQRHYRQSNISGIIDNDTYQLMIQHNKDLLTY